MWDIVRALCGFAADHLAPFVEHVDRRSASNKRGLALLCLLLTVTVSPS